MNEEVKPGEKIEKPKERFNFRNWLKGKSKKDFCENISFLIIIVSAVMVSVGIGLGSFIQGTIFFAVFGSFFVMVGIIIYIASQFTEEAK